MKKILVIMVLFAAFTTGLTAQVLKPVKWQITQKKVSDGVYDIICKALTEHSEAFDMDLKYFINAATFVQRVKVTSAKAKLVGYVEYMSCSGGQCTPPAEADFSFDLTK